MQVWNVLHAANGSGNAEPKNSPKNRHMGTIAPLCWAISSQLRHVSTIRKKFVKQQYLLHMSSQYGELRPTSGWDRSGSLGTPANFNGFRVLAALQHGTPVLAVSQTLRHWTEGATYIRQGGHHVGQCPTFLVTHVICSLHIRSSPPSFRLHLQKTRNVTSLSINAHVKINGTRMWANAQGDGCPAKYRWCSLFNAANFGWRPLLDCPAVTVPRRKTRWNLLGCPKQPNWSQPLVGRRLPYCEATWRRYCCSTSFFSDCRYMP